MEHSNFWPTIISASIALIAAVKLIDLMRRDYKSGDLTSLHLVPLSIYAVAGSCLVGVVSFLVADRHINHAYYQAQEEARVEKRKSLEERGYGHLAVIDPRLIEKRKPLSCAGGMIITDSEYNTVNVDNEIKENNQDLHVFCRGEQWHLAVP